MSAWPLFVILIVVAILIRLAVRSGDGDRVRAYIASRGGYVREVRREYFGRGWLGERNDRLYRVWYIDAEGNEREARAKVSTFGGVFLGDDTLIRAARTSVTASSDPAQREVESLRAENERLREDLRRARGQ
jgi:hypothetical protein